MENSPQYGSNQSGNMKNKKIIQKVIKNLEQAEKLALENRDVESLVIISDRWYSLIDNINHNDSNKLNIGFVSQEKNDDSGKTSNKRSG
jgi:hypothetical protein